MKIEHIAFNIDNVQETADWYVKNLNMTIVRSGSPTSPVFLADSEGETVFEFYRNDKYDIPNYFDISVFTIHIAFTVKDIESVAKNLIAAGATPHEGSIQTTASGDRLGFVRDPNGIPLQLVERVEPLL